MDDHFSRTLLALRRFIGATIPHTELRMRGLLRVSDSKIRVLLGGEGVRQWSIDLPVSTADGSEKVAPWWYVTALRDIATWIWGHGDATLDSEVVDAEYLLSQGVISRDIGSNLDDALDFVIADLVGDPLWHDATASVAPEIYTLVGFRIVGERSVRTYLRYGAGVVGIGFSVVDGASGSPRSTGWWASTKLVAILRDEATLEAHRVPDAEDAYCDAVYDLTRWA